MWCTIGKVVFILYGNMCLFPIKKWVPFKYELSRNLIRFHSFHLFHHLNCAINGD